MPSPIDSIITDSIITWSDLAATCYKAITDQCCNIDSYKNVPLKLQRDKIDGQGNIVINTDNIRYRVNSMSINQTDTESKRTAEWFANAQNLIPLIVSATVNNEWNAFLSAAKIDARSTKVIQAQDMSLVMGLYMQFMAYHLKPVYSRRQVINVLDPQTLFVGTQYYDDTLAGGALTPKYVIPGIDPANVPVITNNDIETIVKNNLGDGSVWCPSGSTPAWKDYILFNSYNAPAFTRHYLD